MVAITVILAAVIGTFVLGLGGGVEQEATAGVSLEVDDNQQYVELTLVTLGNSDYVMARGLGDLELDGEALDSDEKLFLNRTGNSVRVDPNGTVTSGTVIMTAVIGDAPGGVSENVDNTTENPPEEATVTAIQSKDYDFD